ncbi:MAG: hypothetical protein PHS32_05235 [Rhodoferax sp.]|uniref:hypothetical protein n=1 Tax=Rhodoferax sp. TaxID=50421 RepID=UPI00260C9C46|nr:hypothetical protein [Rhodoferax sp.]MDD5333131.1 hypothetical protein [Rhodoferax sp.]
MSMNEDIFYVSDERWFRLTAQGLVETPAWPRLTGPARVVIDGDTLIMGIERQEGKLAHAASRIEKRLRQEGLVEGPAHVRIEAHQAVPEGVQAFYGALLLESWQRLSQWANDQSDHCQLLPLSSLLPVGAGKGRACIVHSGLRLHFYAHGKGGPTYLNVAVAGRGDAELAAAVRLLAERCRAELARGVAAPVVWYSLSETAADLITRLSEQFAGRTAFAVLSASHTTLARGMKMALPALVRQAGVRVGGMTSQARMAWMMERSAPAVAASAATIALGLGALGGGAYLWAHKEKSQRTEPAVQVTLLEQRIHKAASRVLPQDAQAAGAFARQMAVGTVYDPVRMLTLLRTTAGTEVRILRLRLEAAGDKGKSFYFDGVASGTEPIGRLLAYLRSEGWQAQSLVPSDQTPGSFSYRLVPADSPKQRKAA